MRLTVAELGRATLARQLLLRREPLPVTEAVRRLVALQAQEPASPYLALWNRLEGFAPADLDAAVHGAELVKATLLRITLHLVHPEDHPGFHTAMQPSLRSARLADPRFTVSGLTAADADAVLPELLAFLATPRTAEQAQQWLGDQLGVPARPVWWALRQVAPLRHVPTGGPWLFGTRPAYAAVGPPPGGREAWDAALPALVRRYLQAFGPATVADVGQFLLVQGRGCGPPWRAWTARSSTWPARRARTCSTSPARRGRTVTSRRRRGCSGCGTRCCWRTPTAPGCCPRSTAAR